MMSAYLQGFGVFMQACVTFGCVFGLFGVAYLVYIAHLEQKRMTSKNSDK